MISETEKTTEKIWTQKVITKPGWYWAVKNMMTNNLKISKDKLKEEIEIYCFDQQSVFYRKIKEHFLFFIQLWAGIATMMFIPITVAITLASFIPIIYYLLFIFTTALISFLVYNNFNTIKRRNLILKSTYGEEYERILKLWKNININKLSQSEYEICKLKAMQSLCDVWKEAHYANGLIQDNNEYSVTLENINLNNKERTLAVQELNSN